MHSELTQHEICYEFCKEFGRITPARLCGKIYKGIMFGSQTPRRCLELTTSNNHYRRPMLKEIEKDGQFSVFELIDKIQVPKLEIKAEPKQDTLFALRPIRPF